MEIPSWALVPPAAFQTAQQKRFDSVVNEAVHQLTMSLLDPNVANLHTQMSHSTSLSFKTSVRISAQHTIAGIEEDLQKSAASELRESLRKRLGRDVRVYVDCWLERKPKGKGKGTVQMASARVVWW
jgi:hypothetical protein